MPKSRVNTLLEKSVLAMVSAIEIYNKPDYKYRGETFSILALNAWELLLKSKLLKESGNNLSSIYVYERRTTKKSVPSKRQYLRRNRSGNPQTVSIGKSIALLENRAGIVLDPYLKRNLNGLIELRDNAIHFVNDDLSLIKKIQEVATATVQNYVTLLKTWFNYDVNQYKLFVMPLAFFHDYTSVAGISLNCNEKNLLEYLINLEREERDIEESDYHVLLQLDLRFRKSSTKDSIDVRVVTGDPSATPVELGDEDIRAQYPWDYAELNQKLRARYTDFKMDRRYHKIRKKAMKDPNCAMMRFLDPGNPKSQKKCFYSPNILNVFDRHYRRT